MQTIQLNTKSRPSTVICGSGALEEAAKYLQEKDVFVVTDGNVYRLYRELIAEKFTSGKGTGVFFSAEMGVAVDESGHNRASAGIVDDSVF